MTRTQKHLFDMPIDYKKYPADWLTAIRPRILARAGNKCEQCLVPNKTVICRGHYQDSTGTMIPAWQNDDGQIHSALDGAHLGDDYVGEVWQADDAAQRVTKVVLTVAHLDHDIANNEDANLKALCQRCHLAHDKDQHLASARITVSRKRGLQSLFPNDKID